MGLLQLQQGIKELGLARISDPIASDLLWFLEELQRWNRHHNLTAIDGLSSGIEKHLLDSLTLIPLLSGNERLLDVGSGAGLPGLPLKIVLPGLELLSIDSVAKKVRFQRHVIRTLGLHKARAVACRIETLAENAEHAEVFDVVVFRALGRLVDFVPLVLPCLARQGRLILMKGPEGPAELATAEPMLRELGLNRLEWHELFLPGTGAKRTLLVLSRESCKV